MELLSDEYIRGLVEGEGCFTFDTRVKREEKLKVPTFIISMHQRDEELLRLMRTSMKLPKINSNSIYVSGPYRKDGVNRGKMATLIVRDYLSLINVVVPFFYGKLRGYKGVQFQEWIEKIGNTNVPYPYRRIFNLHKQGKFGKFAYYDSKI
ncbi:MAG: LAGLIDADG family homing endonuclease [Patescibacteria group bacterium]